MSYVLDTHAVLWYLLDEKSLSTTAFSLIDDAASKGIPTYISSISLVEVVYLVERQRLPPDAFDLLVKELENNDPTFIAVALTPDIVKALKKIPRNSVPDMPDRIIAATALHMGFPLITRDQKLRSSGIKTLW